MPLARLLKDYELQCMSYYGIWVVPSVVVLKLVQSGIYDDRDKRGNLQSAHGTSPKPQTPSPLSRKEENHIEY